MADNPGDFKPGNDHRFKPGQSGNPGGRPIGARNRLQGDFANELAEHFATHGKDAIYRAANEDPLGYIKVVASLMPKQVAQAEPLEDLTRAELVAGIEFFRTRIAQCDAEAVAAPGQPESVN